MLGVGLSERTRQWLSSKQIGLKQFLVEHPEYFTISGKKGAEIVRFVDAEEPEETPEEEAQTIVPSARAPICPWGYCTAVRLRGLPFTATEEDVFEFFNQPDGDWRFIISHNGVGLVRKKSGKTSGQAIVQLLVPVPLMMMRHALHLRNMGDRYIEIFPETS